MHDQSSGAVKLVNPCREQWHTTLRLMISPFAFLTLRSFIKKYQNLDLATTVLGANIRIRYSFGVGFVSVGRWRPITWYSIRRPGRTDCQSISSA